MRLFFLETQGKFCPPPNLLIFPPRISVTHFASSGVLLDADDDVGSETCSPNAERHAQPLNSSTTLLLRGHLFVPVSITRRN